MWGGIGMLLTVDPRENGNVFSLIPYFPKGIIPISDEGGGNFICLDYRHDNTNRSPKITYYDHEVDLERNFFYLCDSFQELLNASFIPDDVIEDRVENNLYLPDEIIEAWKKKKHS